jgi:hemolysin activation/secretion protein
LFKSIHNEKVVASLPNAFQSVLMVLLAMVSPAITYAATSTTPGAGSILQEIKPQTTQTPSSNDTGLEPPEQEAATKTDALTFKVNKIEVTGNTLFTINVLHSLIADIEGKTINLADLNKLADQITNFYHRYGYTLSQAYIPPQRIVDGVVKISIIEARYGKVILDNQSLVKDSLLNATLSPLRSASVIVQDKLDHVLLLLSDIPGIKNTATFKPGEAFGTSDLLINSSLVPGFNGSVSTDNYGNRYTGQNHLGGNMNFVGPFHHGDLFTFNVLSAGKDMNYARFSYETLLNGAGTRLGGSYSALNYILGDTLVVLDGHGTADVGSLWVRQPIKRSQNLNEYVQLQYDHKQLVDYLDVNSIKTDRQFNNVTLTVSGDRRDNLIIGGASTWSFAYLIGRVGFINAAAEQLDASTSNTQGGFSKITFNLGRLQGLTSTNSIYVNLSGQWAHTNLDPAEKLNAGGPYSVRAYDMGAMSGDSGYLGIIELRHDIKQYWLGQWQAVAFIDSEQLKINHNPWATGTNKATLSGGGLGINWFGSKQFYCKFYVSHPIGAAPSQITAGGATKVWGEINKAF